MPETTHITTSGGLLSGAFVAQLAELGADLPGIAPSDFYTPWQPAPANATELEETIATAWELLQERWDAIRAEVRHMSVSAIRRRWILPLCQLLDLRPDYQRGVLVLDDEGRLRYPISHLGWPDGETEILAPPLHTVAPSQGLDQRSEGGRGYRASSPHDLVQAYLNADPESQWGLLTNGILWRVLREYHHTFTQGYVQFDLEAIFETGSYGDFRALYRLCHASRFLTGVGRFSPSPKHAAISPSPALGEGDQGGEGCLPLESFHKASLSAGIKVGEDLRGQVRDAIETLANGLLDAELIQRLQTDPNGAGDYYAQVLRIIYRLLFMLYAEQRGLVPQPGAELEDLYRQEYSMAALRALAEGDIPREDDHTDLWARLTVTFEMLRVGAPALGVFGYDGMLFEDGEGDWLTGRTCDNSALLRAIRALTLIERDGVLQRIAYADLGVEELGSIYESLLDYEPRLTAGAERVAGRDLPPRTFCLDPRGAERKSTGSYYTHDALVNELIRSALWPVARQRLADAGLPVAAEQGAGLLADYADLSDAQRELGAEALLGMRVCDPAAGSGHFLVKADDALGIELARIRTGDAYPAQAAVQAAKRDVLAHCLYAVDLNPMAVELCKVALWINAAVQDQPLNFLDHHIKCGNALIGATPELLAAGVPYEAFDGKLTGNSRKTANNLRKRNRTEQKESAQSARQDTLWQVTRLFMPPADRWQALNDLAERDPNAARSTYAELIQDELFQLERFAADLWTAAFFWPLAPNPSPTAEWPTEATYRLAADAGPGALDAATVARTRALADRYRFFHWHLEFRDVFGEALTPASGHPSP